MLHILYDTFFASGFFGWSLRDSDYSTVRLTVKQKMAQQGLPGTTHSSPLNMSTTLSPKGEIGVTLQKDESLSETLRFDENYTVTQRLRAGSFGTVFVTRHIGSDEDYAVKVIDRTYVSFQWREAGHFIARTDTPQITVFLTLFISLENSKRRTTMPSFEKFL